MFLTFYGFYRIKSQTFNGIHLCEYNMETTDLSGLYVKDCPLRFKYTSILFSLLQRGSTFILLNASSSFLFYPPSILNLL